MIAYRLINEGRLDPTYFLNYVSTPKKLSQSKLLLSHYLH